MFSSPLKNHFISHFHLVKIIWRETQLIEEKHGFSYLIAWEVKKPEAIMWQYVYPIFDFEKKKSVCRPVSSYMIVYTLRFLWAALAGNNWRERCRHSVLLGVLNIIYSLFGIGTSASRDHRCPIIPFLFLCAAVSLSLFPTKKRKNKTKTHTWKKKKKDDCHNPGTWKSSDWLEEQEIRLI